MKLKFFPVILSMTLFPIFAMAQNSTTMEASFSYERGLQAGYERQLAVRIWRTQTREIQQKLTTLSLVASTSISMPILFGVGPSDFSPNFGVSRDSGARAHEGEDIMGFKGAPIVTPTDAIVIRLGTGSTEGNFVGTANPGGETFVYMHLDKIGEGIEVGKSLAKGDLIGYLGDTGNAIKGPSHLHFEIRNLNGIATDPYPRLASQFSVQEKMNFLSKIFSQSPDPNNLAELLVTNFKPTFIEALNQGVAVPNNIINALSNGSTTFTTVGLPANNNLVLSRNIFIGVRGEDVRLLQKFLNHQGFNVATIGPGSFGFETTYFGPATRAAVVRFQIARGIVPANGYVGQVMRGVIAGIYY